MKLLWSPLRSSRDELWRLLNAGPRRGIHCSPVAMMPDNMQKKEVRVKRKEELRMQRQAMTVAERVMQSQDITLKKHLKKRSSKLLPSSLLEILSDKIHNNDWQAALKVFYLLRAQEWYEPYAGTFVRMFEMLGKCGRHKEASALYQTMVADGCNPTTEAFTALISAYTRSKLLKTALEMLDAMKTMPHSRPDVFTYSLLIKACCDCNQLNKAKELMGEMVTAGVEPNVVTFNTMIQAYGKSGMVNEVEELANRMVASGSTCKPDSWTLNALVKAFGSNGRIDLMEEWYERLSNTGNCIPDTKILHSLMSSYGKAEMFDKLASVIRYIKRYNFEFDTVTYNILLDAYGRSGRLIQMQKTFAGMFFSGHKPDSVTYCTVISHYGKWGLYQRIPGLIERMFKHGIKPDTLVFNSVLDAYRRAGDITSIETYYGMMKNLNCKPDHISYNILISAYRDKSLHDKANAFAVEKEKLTQEDSIAKHFFLQSLRS